MLLKFLFLTSTRVYSTGIGFLLIILSAELLGFDTRGKIAVAVTWMTAFFTFMHMSIGQLGYKIALDSKDRVTEIISYFIAYDLIITIIIGIFLPLIYNSFIPNNIISLSELYYSLPLVTIMMLEQQLLSLFLAFKDTKVLNRISIINKTASLVITTILMLVFPSYLTFIICMFLLSTSMAYSYYFNINNKKYFSFSFSEFISLIRNGISFHFFNAFGYIGYTIFPLLIIPKFVDSNKFALYEIGFKLISLVMIIATSCQLLAMRSFSKEKNIKRSWEQFLYIVLIYFTVSYFVVIVYFIVFPFLIEFNFLSKYRISLFTLKELLPFIPLIGTTAFLPTLFVNLNLLNLSALYNFILGLLCFFLIFILSNLYGVNGIFLGLKISYFSAGILSSIIMLYIYYSKIKGASNEF